MPTGGGPSNATQHLNLAVDLPTELSFCAVRVNVAVVLDDAAAVCLIVVVA